jgi:hypothetical protein
LPGISIPGIDITIDPDGNIDVSIPDLGIDFKVDNPFRGPGAGDAGETPPGDQGVAGETTSPSDEEQEGEDPERNLIGIRVNLTTIPPRANTLFNSSGVVYKGSCFVYFGGAGGYAMQPDAQFANASQFFYAPKGCNRWRVHPNRGFSLTVTPFYEE